MDKHPVAKGIEDVVRTYELLDMIRRRRDVVIRDDQFAYEALAEAARNSRRRGYRLGLLETGRLEPGAIEWLVGEGVRLYSSDEARPKEDELARLLNACRKARSHLAFFQNGPLGEEKSGEAFGTAALKRLLEDGLDLHLTNRIHARDFGLLGEFAEAAGRGRGFLVYYHHGLPVAEMIELAAGGGWIHVADRDIPDEEGFGLVLETAAAAAGAGKRAAVHVEKGLALDKLGSLWAAGAVLIFKTRPSDDASLLGPLERKAARRRLRPRAYYLTAEFLP